MEIFEQLEKRITGLLTRFDNLKAENARFRAEVAEAAAKKTELEEENRTLRASLAQAGNTRAEALKRLDDLLRKIDEHESIE
ncbi:MAG: cell division protein ZapB [Desulfovibrio sp.]|jgi:cell division protein ZapB|nr:cell division protein ZapB [Desulfovibrio sp.]